MLRQVESKFTGFWLCVCLCLRPDMNKKKKFTLPLPQVQFNHCLTTCSVVIYSRWNLSILSCELTSTMHVNV